MRRAWAAERRSRGLGDIAPNLPPGADGYRHGVTLEHFDLGREAADSGAFVRQDGELPRRRQRGRIDGVPRRGRPLPPLRRARLPVVASHAHRPHAEGPGGGDRRLLRCTRTATSAAGRSPAATTSTSSTASTSSRRRTSATDPGFEGRVSVPVLWDKETGPIVNNESAEIIRMLNSEFDAFAEHPEVDLYPDDLRAEIDRINERVYEEINNGVYRAGFARSQEAYDEAFDTLFAALALARGAARRAPLPRRRPHHRGRLAAVPDARALRRRLLHALPLQRPADRRPPEPVGLRARALRSSPGWPRRSTWPRRSEHYYTTHDELNPKRIIPRGPFQDWTAPHGRGA